MDVASLDAAIQKLYREGAWHRRRGFKLSEAKSAVISNHLLEECVELQAELYAGTFCTQIAEAADVLLVYLYALFAHGIPLSAVIERAAQKLDESFVSSPDEVETASPGFARAARAAGKAGG